MNDLRGIPRAFVPGATMDGPFELPSEEADKFRKVLRLGTGDKIAILPNDGSLWICQLDGKRAVPLARHEPMTEPLRRVAVAQALPKGDRLDEIVRACTEIGVAEFLLFASDRSVVRWDADKLAARVKRFEAIARESAEVSFRTRIPVFSTYADLKDLLRARPDCVVLSEVEGLPKGLPTGSGDVTLVVGPEGGWAPRELTAIGGRGVTLGPRILRVDHAAAAAAAIMLLQV